MRVTHMLGQRLLQHVRLVAVGHRARKRFARGVVRVSHVVRQGGLGGKGFAALGTLGLSDT